MLDLPLVLRAKQDLILFLVPRPVSSVLLDFIVLKVFLYLTLVWPVLYRWQVLQLALLVLQVNTHTLVHPIAWAALQHVR